MRLLRSGLSARDVRPKIPEIVDALYRNIPSGVGSHRRDLRLSRTELESVLGKGAPWAVARGFGRREDLLCVEDGGLIGNADPGAVSDRAYERGKDQLGTLGSGNHFVEVGCVDEVYDEGAAQAMGLFRGRMTVMIHTGSRGLGYQICDDAIREMIKASEKYGFVLPDRQLCAAPVQSPEGRRYLSAMAGAANYAFANRQIITHWVRETLEEILREPWETLGLSVVYDVCHNIAKIERHRVGGKERDLCVHRKGATRAYGPGRREVPEPYASVGQPVLVPGDMGRASYVLCGTEKAMEETFGSTCHGAGRIMSRSKAVKAAKGRKLPDELRAKGIHVRAASRETLAEEMPDAYKDVSKVVKVVHDTGISRLVARIVPLGSIKG